MELETYKKDEKQASDMICEPLVKYEAIILDPAKRYSYADYLTWADDKMRELIDGIIHIMSPAPKLKHQRISDFEINMCDIFKSKPA